MARKHSHLVSLIEVLCDTLSECGRIEAARNPDRFALSRARDIRAATEPLAIDCLDEETCDLPPVVRQVYRSASLRLVDHLERISNRTCILTETDWSLLLLSADTPTIEALLDRRLSPSGALLPMLREIQSGKTRLIGTLFNRIAQKAPLEASQIDTILEFRWRKNKSTGLDVTAQLLRKQVEAHPHIIADEMAKGLDEHMGKYRATAMILAGLKPQDIIPKANLHTNHGRIFLERVSSKHGLLSLHQACGSLENFLTGGDEWIKWMARDMSHAKTANALEGAQ